jgi:hypothetical protein
LRALALTGVTSPDAIQTLAESCTLEELESLTFGICEVPEPPPVLGGLTGAVGAMLSEMLTRFFSTYPLPPGPIRWRDYWPALLALARSPVLPRLRTLQVTDSGPRADGASDLLRHFMRRDAGELPAANPDDLFPDTLVGALAAGLNADKLVRLELPAARLTLAGRAELTRRFGPRLVLA